MPSDALDAAMDALGARLDKAERDLREVGGYENELQYIPAGGVRSLLADLRALLAQPAPAPYNRCSVCCGEPLKSGRECICGGIGTEAAEMHGLRVHCFELQDQLDKRPHLSRAEAEAMVDAYDDALSTWDHWNEHEYRDHYRVSVDKAEKKMVAARTALLRALTREGT